MKDCLDKFPKIKTHPFKIIAFDWDGTAVVNRSVDAQVVTSALENLMKFGVYIVVITGTNFGNVNRQFASLVKGEHKKNLFVCTDRGSEVYGFDESSEPVLLYRREATEEEENLLSKVAEAVKNHIESDSEATIDIVYNRLNRRKIDLIPEWENPPKSQIDELLVKTEERLVNAGYSEGIKGAYNLTVSFSDKLGLTDARITSDVKHVEVGLTDKSDSINWVIEELAKKRNIPFSDILVLGDEFGPIAGFEGSDFRMYLAEAPGMAYVSVGKEPNGVPEGVHHIGGGPDCFLELINRQCELYAKLQPSQDRTFLLIHEGYDPIREREIESVSTVGNGYLGTRGSLEEQRPESEPATLVAGVFDRSAADDIEELVIVPDWVYSKIYIDGDELSLEDGRVLEHRRVLDMKKGILFRTWRHRSNQGRITRVSFTRLASFADPHALLMKISVVPENYSGEIRVETGLEACSKAGLVPGIIEKGEVKDGGGVMIATKTEFTDIVTAQVQLSRAAPGMTQYVYRTFVNDCGVNEEFLWQASEGQMLEVEKFVSIYTSRDLDDPIAEAMRGVAEYARRGYNEMLIEHIDVWERRWDVAAVKIDGDDQAQLWANFAGYHLMIAGTPFDERVSISARTLTGTIYKGHVFWDTEIFMLPFFIYTHPPTARALVMYRYHTLPGARKEAEELSLRGALYAWESTITGEEMTPESVIAPNGEVILILSGKMEQHINCAVAYGVWHYWVATGDHDFFVNAGIEMLIETARFWVSRAEEQDGIYHIYNIEGPDEYHEIVNDSIYTNMMAVWNIRTAASAIEHVKQCHPEKWSKLADKINFNDTELVHWDDVATNMYKDMDHEYGNVIEQFDGYFDLEDINVYDYEPREAPLDTILGRDRTAMTQLVKQADVVLLLYLLEHEFSEQVIKENFEYYEPRTGHGSSLSPAMYGLVAARLGLTDMAMRFFHQAGQIDLANNMGNAAGGVHAAALGGFWQHIINGFAGVRVTEEGLFVDPKLPEQWARMRFSLIWRDDRIDFDIRRDKQLELTLRGINEVNIGIFGKGPQVLSPGEVYTADWDGQAWQEFSRADKKVHYEG